RLRERRRRALPATVRQRAPPPRREEGRHHRARRRDPARPTGNVRLRRQGGRDGRGAAGDARSDDRRRHGRRHRRRGERAGRRRRRRQAAARRGGPREGRERGAGTDGVNPSRLFILRPVATSLLMAAIMLAGMLAYRQLPVSALPQVDYPTIQVLTFYPGASPDVMASSVTSPLERQFGQMPGLNQMMSTSS